MALFTESGSISVSMTFVEPPEAQALADRWAGQEAEMRERSGSNIAQEGDEEVQETPGGGVIVTRIYRRVDEA